MLQKPRSLLVVIPTQKKLDAYNLERRVYQYSEWLQALQRSLVRSHYTTVTLLAPECSPLAYVPGGAFFTRRQTCLEMLRAGEFLAVHLVGDGLLRFAEELIDVAVTMRIEVTCQDQFGETPIGKRVHQRILGVLRSHRHVHEGVIRNVIAFPQSK
jgi:uncharacterized Fe-S cluster-containing radical SAM superfamily enzyme